MLKFSSNNFPQNCVLTIMPILKYIFMYFLGTQKHRSADLWPPFERLYATDPSRSPRVCWNGNDGPGNVQKVGRKLIPQYKEWENMLCVFLAICHDITYSLQPAAVMIYTHAHVMIYTCTRAPYGWMIAQCSWKAGNKTSQFIIPTYTRIIITYKCFTWLSAPQQR